MRVRGAWGITVTVVGVATLICAVLLTLSGSFGKGIISRKRATPGPEMNEAANRQFSRDTSRWKGIYASLPLSFEENQGQSAPEVRYVSHGPGYELFLTAQEAVIALQRSTAWNLSPLHRAQYFGELRRARQAGRMTVLRMGLERANLQTKISGIDPLPGNVSYFLGNRPERWLTGIPTYAQVKYSQVYPGVDLMFYGNQRRLEYDFVVAPGADPKTIALNLKSARHLRISQSGRLIVTLAGGPVVFEKPIIYQLVDGERKSINGGYALAGERQLTFSVSDYDRSRPLIIDPVLNYSTYLGGSAAGDVGSSIAVDSNGDAFVTGTTFSTNFPTKNGFGAGNATSGVAFVTELNPSGTALLYSTYLGGTGGDSGLGIALDPAGNIYVAGLTFSTDFPTTPLASPACPTSITALKQGPNAGAASGTSFVSKINPTVSGACSLVYSSYLGGVSGSSFPDFANAVTADANGNAYVTGFTGSSPGSALGNFPITSSAFQSTLGGSAGNTFLTKINTTLPGAQSLIYSTYLGGNGADATSSTLGFGEDGLGVALDASNNAYIMGTTTSTNFPTTSNALQPNTAPPAAVAMGTGFVSRFDTTLSGVNSLVYSTYLGGNISEFGTAIAVKPNSTIAYVTGTSSSPAFPTFPANAFQTASATTFPAGFVSLIDTSQPAGTALVYSTFLGGNTTTGFGIGVDALGNAYVAGGTNQTAFPTSEGAFQGAFAAGASAEGFLSKLNPGGNGAADLVYSTFFGGSGNAAVTGGEDAIHAIAIDASKNAYITGPTFSATTFPVFPPASAAPPAFQTSLPSGATSAAFVAKLTLIPTLAVSPSSINFGTQPKGMTSAPQTVTLTNNTSDPIQFATSNLAFTGSNAADFASPSNTCGSSIAAGSSCTVTLTFTPSTAAAESATLVITVTIKDGGLSSSQAFSVSLSGTGSASAPGVGLSPASLTFSGQLLTTASAAKTVTLTNTGTAALTINSIAASSDFAETSTGASACPISPATLAAGANCTISVTFAPTAVGARAGTLTITDNAGGSPHTAALSGTGWNFTLTAPASASVKAGQTTNFNVTMTPLGGFNQTVTLACSGEPNKSTCVLAPPSVTASDGTTAQTSVVTVMTQGLLVPQPTTPAPPLSLRKIFPLALALLLLLILLTTSQLRTRLAMATSILILIAVAGCGSYNGTTKGTTNLTITGTNGGVTETATVTLTVN